jgi:hypothetical protein
MECLTRSQALEKARACGLREHGAPLRIFPHEGPRTESEIRSLAEWLGSTGSVLLLANEWFHERDEEMNSLALLRSSAGETRALEDSPAFLFKRGETDSMTSLITIFLGGLTWWKVTCYALSKKFVIVFEDCREIIAYDASIAKKLEQVLG